MKTIRLLFTLLFIFSITLSTLGQTVRSNSFEIPYVDTPSSNPLKQPVPEFKYREASGMARIIPVFAPNFPTEYQVAASYACKLMEESLPTCYPIYVIFKEKPMGNKAIRALVKYTEIAGPNGNVSHLLNNATIKRAETYAQYSIYPRPLKIGADHPDGEIILTTKDIYYSDLNPAGCPKDKYDLVTLILHALGRILGMDITAYPASIKEESISPFIVVNEVSPSNPNGFKTISFAPNYASAILYSNLAPNDFYDTAITHNYWHNTYYQSAYHEGDWYRIATASSPVLICPVKGKTRTYRLHSERGRYTPQALQYFAIEPENTETLLFQPIIKKGVAIHKVGKGLIDALLVSGWVESNPLIVGLGNEEKEPNSSVNKDFMIFSKSSPSRHALAWSSNQETDSYDNRYSAYRLDQRGPISKSVTGLYVQKKDGSMERVFSYERDYQFPEYLDRFCGKDPMKYFAGRNMDTYAKTSDGLIKLMNVGALYNGETSQAYIRYLYAMVEPESPQYTIDERTNVLHFTERFFSQEVEVIETEYLFGEPIYTTYPVRSGECSVQLSSEDSDITIVARNKAGETKTRLLRSHTVNPIKVIVDGNIVTVKSEVPISSCQIQSVMSMEKFQVSQSDQYTCSGTVDKEGKFIATVIDRRGGVYTANFIVP